MLAHGGGGQLTDDLLASSILPRLDNAILGQLLDAAILPALGSDRPAMTIDCYVVEPWKFPGGDIGRLAISGTVNDLAVCGAEPLGIALGLILTEGFSRTALETVLDSVRDATEEAGVHVLTGDTKVVGHGHADGIYIATAGVGRVARGRDLSPDRIQPGDALIVNGPVGEHGLAVMLARDLPEVESALRTDAAPVNHLVARVLDSAGDDVAFMRDPTRSGVAGVAADIARQSRLHVTLEEEDIPLRPEARHAADMLGLDPLEVANEGKVICVVREPAIERVLDAMRRDPLGREAAVIGRVEEARDGVCELRTTIGGRRILQKPYGEQLPRIC